MAEHSEVNTQATSQYLWSDDAFADVWSVAGDHQQAPESVFTAELSGFLGEEQYRCKRPLLGEFFSSRYPGTVSDRHCAGAVPFLVNSGLEGQVVTWLDPRRVREIHVLFAGRGESIVSRFGHLSFRLVVCPEDDLSGNACDQNLFEHVVLGYRAHVDDFSIDYWSGLFGHYRAHLYANPFMEVYQEYAIGEFRELYSLPLKLSRGQVERMVRELSEIHWSYSGEYRFLTNNCSSLAQKYLLQSWSELGGNARLRDIYWRPDRFFRSLRNSEFADGDALSDLDKAERKGHFFPSTRPVYDEAFELVSEARADSAFVDLDDYLATHPMVRLSKTRQNKTYEDNLRKKPRLLEAQMLLEELSLVRNEKRLMAEFSHYFSNTGLNDVQRTLAGNVSEAQYNAFTQCVYRPVIEQLRPRKIESGIPGAAQANATLNDGLGDCAQPDTQSDLKAALSTLQSIDAEGWEPVNIAMKYWANSLEALSVYSDYQPRPINEVFSN